MNAKGGGGESVGRDFIGAVAWLPKENFYGVKSDSLYPLFYSAAAAATSAIQLGVATAAAVQLSPNSRR